MSETLMIMRTDTTVTPQEFMCQSVMYELEELLDTDNHPFPSLQWLYGMNMP